MYRVETFIAIPITSPITISISYDTGPCLKHPQGRSLYHAPDADAAII